MKKIIAFTLAALLILSMAACESSKDAEQPAVKVTEEPVAAEEPTVVTPPAEAQVQETPAEAEESAGLEVDKGLFNVTVTIPADFVGESMSQEECDELAKEEGYKSVTLNEDGSVTYVMTRSQHESMMAEVRSNIDESMAEMCSSEDYPSFVSVEVNDSYTDFTIICQNDELSMTESFSTLVFFLTGGMYNAFNGTPADNIHVAFINEATGAVIHEANSSELG